MVEVVYVNCSMLSFGLPGNSFVVFVQKSHLTSGIGSKNFFTERTVQTLRLLSTVKILKVEHVVIT